MNLKEAKKVILEKILSLKEEKSEKLVRIAVRIEPVDILAWLKAQDNSFKKIYWRDRASNFLCGGIGEAVSVKGRKFLGYEHIFKEINRYLSISLRNVRFYGGISFPSAVKEKEWEKFGYYYFLIPLFELIKDSTGVYFICNLKLPVKNTEAVVDQLDKVKSVDKSISFSSLSVQYDYRIDIPDIVEWEKQVKDVMEEIRRNTVTKVVLARKSIFKLKSLFDVYSFLNNPKWKEERAYHFLIQLDPFSYFVGMSPERIYFRKNRYIEAEAIAGTRRRGTTMLEDESFSKELKNSVKELQEHRLVSSTLKKRMSFLCASVKLESEEEILKLSYAQHLYTKFSGMLMNGISDNKIISVLYPNPAIAGYPVDKSLNKIAEIEKFDRGWYSGPFGWITHDSAEFVVSIRSALIMENFLYLYSGAGLVKGSDPLNEWKELDNKILNFTAFLKNAGL